MDTCSYASYEIITSIQTSPKILLSSQIRMTNTAQINASNQLVFNTSYVQEKN
jgi:hypothetical protein